MMEVFKMLKGFTLPRLIYILRLVSSILKKIYKLELGKLLFQTINTTKFPDLQSMLTRLNWNHNFNTPKINPYRLPRTRISIEHNSFLFQGVKLWNSRLPISIWSALPCYPLKTASQIFFFGYNFIISIYLFSFYVGTNFFNF